MKIQLDLIPTHAGVYQFLDNKQSVLYVGKAKNLKARLTHYATETRRLSRKTQQLLTRSHDLKLLTTTNEAEALLLENQLIKQHQPRYNILLKDDKTYPYLRLCQHTFPGLTLFRGKKKQPSHTYFGPYPNVQMVKSTLSLLQKIFKLRSCSDHELKSRTRPCLQYQIKRCSAPCVNAICEKDYAQQVTRLKYFLNGEQQQIIQPMITEMTHAAEQHQYETASEIRDQIRNLKAITPFLGGNITTQSTTQIVDVVSFLRLGNHCVMMIIQLKNDVLLNTQSFTTQALTEEATTTILQQHLTQYYLNKDFAYRMPSRIYIQHSIKNLSTLKQLLLTQHEHPIRILSQIPKAIKSWVTLANLNAKTLLTKITTTYNRYQHAFKALSSYFKRTINRIECIDISHHQGKDTFASCVAVTQEGLLKSAYRHYRIHQTNGDDYQAIRLAVMKRLNSQSENIPDVLLIDGGKGQLHTAYTQLATLNLANPPLTLSIVKGERRHAKFDRIIYYTTEHAFQTLQFPPHSPERLLFQQIRDEAHRYALHQHRKNKNARSMHSILDTIHGLGTQKKQQLLNHFGGLQGLKKAHYENLLIIAGIGPVLAKRIHTALSG